MSEHREGLIDPMWDVKHELARIRAEKRELQERSLADAKANGAMFMECEELRADLKRLVARVAELERERDDYADGASVEGMEADRLRARVAALEEVVEVAREVMKAWDRGECHWTPEFKIIRGALAKLDNETQR